MNIQNSARIKQLLTIFQEIQSECKINPSLDANKLLTEIFQNKHDQSNKVNRSLSIEDITQFQKQNQNCTVKIQEQNTNDLSQIRKHVSNIYFRTMIHNFLKTLCKKIQQNEFNILNKGVTDMTRNLILTFFIRFTLIFEQLQEVISKQRLTKQIFKIFSSSYSLIVCTLHKKGYRKYVSCLRIILQIWYIDAFLNQQDIKFIVKDIRIKIGIKIDSLLESSDRLCHKLAFQLKGKDMQGFNYEQQVQKRKKRKKQRFLQAQRRRRIKQKEKLKKLQQSSNIKSLKLETNCKLQESSSFDKISFENIKIQASNQSFNNNKKEKCKDKKEQTKQIHKKNTMKNLNQPQIKSKNLNQQIITCPSVNQVKNFLFQIESQKQEPQYLRQAQIYPQSSVLTSKTNLNQPLSYQKLRKISIVSKSVTESSKSVTESSKMQQLMSKKQQKSKAIQQKKYISDTITIECDQQSQYQYWNESEDVDLRQNQKNLNKVTERNRKKNNEQNINFQKNGIQHNMQQNQHTNAVNYAKKPLNTHTGQNRNISIQKHKNNQITLCHQQKPNQNGLKSNLVQKDNHKIGSSRYQNSISDQKYVSSLKQRIQMVKAFNNTRSINK